MDMTTCPDCGAAAEIRDRSVWESTSGPVEHVQVRCVRRHVFFMPVEGLDLHHAGTRPVAEVKRAAESDDRAGLHTPVRRSGPS